jgi:hypothetical protein
MSSAPGGWTFNGSSAYDVANGVGVLTQDQTGALGSILFQHAIVTDTFDASFDFRLSHAATPYADGMGFVLIKNDSSVARIDTALGLNGGGLGMMAPTATGSSTVLTGYGVELDTYDNDYPTGTCGETVNGDHVNVDTLSQCFISGGSVPTPLATAKPYTLGDGSWHTATVHLANGQLSLSIKTQGTSTTLFSNVSLSGFHAGDSFFFGFTGSCGGYSQRQEVRNISITFPTPRCL